MTSVYDVLVVGAGPAGCSAARAAAEEGARVLMIEKRSRIGAPVQCAGYIPRLLKQKVNIPAEAIAQRVQEMITFMPDGEVIRKKAPGFILYRGKFDRALARAASAAGAEIHTGAMAVSKEGRKVKIRGPGGENTIEVSLVVGADGPGSTVGAWIGQQNKKVMQALQHTVVLRQPARDTEVYFSKEYPGGYAWLFPKGKVANVGVGVQSELGGRIKPALRVFKESINARIGDVVGVTSGRIPVGGPLRSIDERARTILVGDAAGHTHAVTGGGIPQAVICGAMAGRAAAAAADGHRHAFQNYYHQWRSAFGSMMDRAAAKREQLEAGWHAADLMDLLKRSWVACEEYYDA